MSRHDEKNPALRLATQVAKIVLSCPLGITCCDPQEIVFCFSYNKSFIDQAWLDKMARYWP